jgi:hypothetical protein
MAWTQRKNKSVISELDLDRAFANQLASSRDFSIWVLEQTKFKPYSRMADLLDKEQVTAKPRKKPENWWRHWWCKLEDGSESETDIFASFQLRGTNLRFALHIEDKPSHGKFEPSQYLNYKRRATCMARQPQYMDYTDFTTVLLAPSGFIQAHRQEAACFDSCISYESVAPHIPLFGRAVAQAANA